MAVESRHVNANLRFKNTERETALHFEKFCDVLQHIRRIVIPHIFFICAIGRSLYSHMVCALTLKQPVSMLIIP